MTLYFRFLICISFSFIISFQCFAQTDGYFITQKNDTVKCSDLKEAFIGKNLKYRATKLADFKDLNTDTVLEYKLPKSKNPFTKRQLPGDSVLKFVEWTLRGPIDLYTETFYSYGGYGGSGGSGGSNKVNNYYISKNNVPLIAIKTTGLSLNIASRKERKKALYDMMADAPQLIEQYKAFNEFGYEVVYSMISRYNDFKSTHPN